MRSILLPLCLIVTLQALSQQVVSVDKSTGRALASIPIWTVKERNLSVPISLYYASGSGVQVGSDDKYLGLGWAITGAGSVTRQLNSLPDDYTGTSPDERKGWLTSYNGQTVGDYIQNLDLTGTSDQNQLNLNTLYNSSRELILDPEPDIFTVDAPGLSLQFVFDEDGDPQAFPHSHVKINAERATDGTITRFILTDANGNKYHFDKKVNVQKQTVDLDIAHAEGFFKNEYDSYKDQITYTSQWMLTKMESYYSGDIRFYYTGGSTVTNQSKVELNLRKNTSGEDYEVKEIFRIDTEYTPQLLTNIRTSSGQSADFTLTGDRLTRISLTDSRRSSQFIKSFDFSYDGVSSSVTTGGLTYLRRVQEVSGCDKYPPYVFTYNNEANFPTDQTNSIDYWGYFNAATNDDLYPSLDIYPNETADKNKVQLHRDITPAGKTKYTLAGADRTPNPATVANAMLEEVQLPMGDKIRIYYEPNVYFDTFLNQEVTGPGVRVKSMNRFEYRISSMVNEVISFYYTADRANYTTGAVSGVVSGIPKYHVLGKDYINGSTTITYATLDGSGYTEEEKWQYLTARTSQNIGQAGQVYYSDVIERKSGENGFRVSKFILPPSENAIDALWTDYAETSIGAARATSCSATGLTGQGAGVFPYAQAAMSGNESVLAVQEDIIDGSLRLLNRQESTYQRLTLNNGTVRGIKLDAEPNSCVSAYVYGAYNIAYGVQIAADQNKSLTYEFDGTTNHSMQSITDYAYTGSGHLYPTSVISTDAEGNKFKSETVYPGDYGITSAAQGTPENALQKLVIDNRIAIPVESVSSQELSGETGFTVTGGSYRTFKKINEKVVAATSQALVLGQPLSGFQLSDHTAGSLSPASQYETRMTYTDYNNNYRVTKTDNPITRTQNSTVWNDELQTASLQLRDVDATEVYFNNFTSVNPEGTVFFLNGSPADPLPVGAGRNDQTSLRISNGVKLEGSINSTDDDYLVSFWAKRDIAGSLRLELKNSASGSVIRTYDIPVAVSTTWEFYAQAIDLSGLNNEVFFEFKWLFGSDNTYIDDFMIAPARGSVTSRIVEFPYGVKSVTDHIAGQSSVTYVDNLGRTDRIEDSRGNIRKLFKYEYANLPAETFTTYIKTFGDVFENDPVLFEAKELCMDNVTYEWAFVDSGVTPGPGDYTDSGPIVMKTFTNVGTKKAYLRIKKSGYPDYDATPRTFQVQQEVLSVDACAKGKLGLDLCGNYLTLPQECSSITGSPSNDFEVLYGVDAVSGGDGNYTYQWQKRTIGGDWVNVVTPLDGQIAICQSDNYEVKLVVTDGQSSARTGESQVFSVIHYQSDPQCTPTTGSCN